MEALLTAQGAELAPPSPPITLEGLIAAWLHAKVGRSKSAKTERAYQDTIEIFRAVLVRLGLDLDADSTAVALAAQGWAGQHAHGGEVSPATYNQRLAILSSFYRYAIKHRALDHNPIDLVERRPVQHYGNVQPLDLLQLKAQLASIDRRDLAGARDYALLSIFLITGRRLSEVASLRWRDLAIAGDSVTITIRRAKGGKVMRDTLAKSVGAALMAWLQRYYGAGLGVMSPDAPLWPALSPRNKGQALGVQSIADICERRFGMRKVHSLRHTFARSMEDAGAKVSEIQGCLGHASLSTTGRYLAALRSADNPHAETLAHMLGLDGE